MNQLTKFVSLKMLLAPSFIAAASAEHSQGEPAVATPPATAVNENAGSAAFALKVLKKSADYLTMEHLYPLDAEGKEVVMIPKSAAISAGIDFQAINVGGLVYADTDWNVSGIYVKPKEAKPAKAAATEVSRGQGSAYVDRMSRMN